MVRSTGGGAASRRFPEPQQLGVRAGFTDPALVQGHDTVRAANRREPVGDDDGRAARKEHVQRLLDQRLASESTEEVASSRMSRGGSMGERPANASSCFCPTERPSPALADLRIVAQRQPADEDVGADAPRGLLDASIVIARVPEGDVSRIVPARRKDILEHEPPSAVQVALGVLPEVPAVEQHRAGLRGPSRDAQRG